jgi:hypothetical protein
VIALCVKKISLQVRYRNTLASKWAQILLSGSPPETSQRERELPRSRLKLFELLFYREKKEKTGEQKTTETEKRKKFTRERKVEKKLNIVTVWKPPRQKAHAKHVRIACARSVTSGLRTRPISCRPRGAQRHGDLSLHRSRLDKLYGLLRTRGDAAWEWLGMATEEERISVSGMRCVTMIQLPYESWGVHSPVSNSACVSG